MNNTSINRSDPSINPFEEWISHLAESKGVSEEEIIHQMISSYWVLDELTRMMTAQHPENESAPDYFQRRAEPETADPSGQPRNENAESAEGTTDHELIELLEKLINLATEPGDPVEKGERDVFRSRREGDRIVEWMSELSEKVERIETRLDQQAAEQRADERSSQLEAVTQDVSERMDALESKAEEIASTEEVNELREDVERIEGRLDKQARTSDRRAIVLASRLETVKQDTSEQLDALESKVDTNLDTVEDILTHLLQSLNNVEDRTDSLVRTHSEIKPLVAEYEDHQRLNEIKRTANQKGAQTASCDACDNTIDIGLLSKPECPHCDRPFEILTSRSWLWKTKQILETGAKNTQRGPLPTVASAEGTRTDVTGSDPPANRTEGTPR